MHVEPQAAPRLWRQAQPLDAMASLDVLKGMLIRTCSPHRRGWTGTE